ncbi:hypothetical protein I7I51_05155 [Histoplasma capsulatum]|uniref:Uncharacterized protein n=1 Tax=Ajellomyces capsulatus TaxID=5037 RepID=A0A8A1M830_AJECA|nr:hypothetical protein I7I51_05155 [Histoplasma capsulatum]
MGIRSVTIQGHGIDGGGISGVDFSDIPLAKKIPILREKSKPNLGNDKPKNQSQKPRQLWRSSTSSYHVGAVVNSGESANHKTRFDPLIPHRGTVTWLAVPIAD